MVSEGRCGMAPIAGEYNFKLRRYQSIAGTLLDRRSNDRPPQASSADKGRPFLSRG
jgi:hypothetical protein